MLTVLFFLISAALSMYGALKTSFPSPTLRFYVLVSLVFVNLGFFLNHLATGAVDGAPSSIGVMVTSLGLLSVVIGAIIGRHVFAKPPSSTDPNGISPIDRSDARLLTLSAVILIPTWSYFVFLGFVPLFDAAIAIATSGIDGLGVLNQSRLSRDAYVDASASRIPLQGLLEIYRNLGVPVLFAFAYAQKRAGASPKLRIVIMGLSVISVLAAGQRWPLMYLIAAGVFVMFLQEGALTRRAFRNVALLAVALGILLSALQARTLARLDDTLSALNFGAQNLFARIVTDQVAIPIASYYRENPQLSGNLGRTYLMSLSSYLPGEGASYPVEFYRVVTGDTAGYTAPPDFYTEAFVNFSWLGVVGVSLIWGGFLAFAEGRMYRNRSAWDVGIKSGLLTVLVFSAFTGVVFTLSFAFVAVGCHVARLLTPRTGARDLEHALDGRRLPRFTDGGLTSKPGRPG